MTKRKQPVHKHLAFDPDLFERSEKSAELEEKSLNAWVNDAIRFKLESTDAVKVIASDSQNQNQNQEQNITGGLDEADRILRNQVIPMIKNSKTPQTTPEKESFASLKQTVRLLNEAMEIVLGIPKALRQVDISKYNPFEQIRQQGLKAARERRDKEERAELMAELPQPIEAIQDGEDIGANKEDINIITSSTIGTHLTQTEWLALKRQEEDRDKRLKGITSGMKKQAKDSIRLVDETKETPTADDDKDIPISPVDGNEGIHEDEEPEDDS